MKLHIADNLSLPLEAVTQTFAFLAKRGKGKTYCASVLAEEMLKAGQQIVALDPTGAWWGLRSGFPILVAGGEHGDLPLEEHAGEVLASAIVENRLSAIIDFGLMRKGQVTRFMVAFAETLYRLNREPLHLFVDEADAFAPQGRNYTGGEDNRLLGAMEDIVRRGRKRGIGCSLISQRPAVINKNVLTQCESLFVFGLGHPRDIDAVMEWVHVHADETQAKEMLDSLPTLKIGETWFWSPGWMEMMRRVQIRTRETFDSSATPKPGQTVRAPKAMKQIDVAALGDKIKATVTKAKENDPAELKREIARLKAELQKRPTETKVETKEVRVEVPVLKNGQLDKAIAFANRMEALATKCSDAASTIAATVISKMGVFKSTAAPPRPAMPAPKPRPNPMPAPIRHPVEKLESLDVETTPQGGLRRMLIALANRNGISAKALGVRAGLSSSSGTFGTYLGQGRSKGWIQGGRDNLQITEAGMAALGDYAPLPSGQALLAYWLSELGGGAARMLEVLACRYPNPITAEELGEAAGLAAGSGTFGTYLGKLRTLELVSGTRGALMASQELFE